MIEEVNGNIVNSTPYHPRTNGQIERPHQTLKNKIRALLDQKPNTPWSELLEEALYLYNNRTQRSTKYAPMIIEGFNIKGKFPNTTTTPVAPEELERIRKEVETNLQKAADYREKHYNETAKPMNIQVGDEVVVRLSKLRKDSMNAKFPYKGVVTEVAISSVKLTWLYPPPGHQKGEAADRTFAFDQIKFFKKHIPESPPQRQTPQPIESALLGNLFGILIFFLKEYD